MCEEGNEYACEKNKRKTRADGGSKQQGAVIEVDGPDCVRPMGHSK